MHDVGRSTRSIWAQTRATFQIQMGDLARRKTIKAPPSLSQRMAWRMGPTLNDLD